MMQNLAHAASQHFPGLLKVANSCLAILFCAFLSGCATDFTVGQSNICEVHHIAMRRTLVYGLPPIACVLVYYSPDHQKLQKAYPHASEFMSVSKTRSSMYTTPEYIYVCPACEKDAQQWEARAERGR